ncbi:MAG: APC family permease [Gammaproteobacteria bacterium]
MSRRIPLKRSLSLPLLVLYGLGTTIGAGIYALIGEIAGVAGYLAPAAFLLASLMAGITALGFAELATRMPRAAGEALYVKEGFRSTPLSTVTGLLVTLGGLVSAAALVNGFVGYLHEFVHLPRPAAIVVVTLALGAAAAWGIKESVLIASLLTLVEIGGLLLVIAVSAPAAAGALADWPALLSLEGAGLSGVFSAALLAFYAFIGFEDMVNVAEEVRDVRRNLPRGILLTLLITTLVYLVLMITAVLAVPPGELAASKAPLAYLYEHATGRPATLISLIALFAILNGALIQIVMGARVLYGMSVMSQLPAALGGVSVRTRTPLLATTVVTLVVIGFALPGRLASLAEMTSLTMLTVFALVNLALWRIKRRDPRPPRTRVLPMWVPAAGFLISLGFVLAEVASLLMD